MNLSHSCMRSIVVVSLVSTSFVFFYSHDVIIIVINNVNIHINNCIIYLQGSLFRCLKEHLPKLILKL